MGIMNTKREKEEGAGHRIPKTKAIVFNKRGEERALICRKDMKRKASG